MCLEGAVRFDWSIMGRELQERIVEHAAAIAASPHFAAFDACEDEAVELAKALIEAADKARAE